jgi:hypothetical protein
MAVEYLLKKALVAVMHVSDLWPASWVKCCPSSDVTQFGEL